MRYPHAPNLFKNWNNHSIEAGGFFELLISKKVIHEEQKQLCSLVQVKEMANCSFIKSTCAHWTYLCWFYKRAISLQCME